jgi:hypothetical protein
MRIDVHNITPELMEKVEIQLKLLGLKNKSEYLRLIMELDCATGLVQTLLTAQNKK